MKWRDHLPNECPPDDAIPTNGVVYRLASRKNFDESDFLSYREMYPDGHWDGVPECIACGLSVFTEIAGIERLLRRVPGKKRSKSHKVKKVIEGKLTPKHGKMKNTPSTTHKSHHTWWIPVGEEPWKVFRLIELPEDRTS